jgi:hypothetical protein
MKRQWRLFPSDCEVDAQSFQTIGRTKPGNQFSQREDLVAGSKEIEGPRTQWPFFSGTAVLWSVLGCHTVVVFDRVFTFREVFFFFAQATAFFAVLFTLLAAFLTFGGTPAAGAAANDTADRAKTLTAIKATDFFMCSPSKAAACLRPR